MARRSLKPQLNQIRTWVRQGRTDAWIAHQLEVSVREIDSFKRDHDLAPDGGGDDADAAEPFDDERDMRAEDDALVAAELDALGEAEAAEDEPAVETDSDETEPSEAEPSEDGDGDRRPRRRGRRGGRRRRGAPRGPRGGLEGTFDHGEEGYGLWLDPAVQDDAVYAEHWAGHRPIVVTIEADQIVVRRRGEDGAEAESDDD